MAGEDEATARRGAGRWRRLARGLALVVALPVVFALALPVLMLGQEITAPTWITERVEAQAARALRGGRLEFGEITLTVGADLHPVVRLRDSTLTDGAGVRLARVPEVAIRLSPRGLVLRREALPQEIVLRGPELALLRRPNGAFALVFEPGAASEAVELSPDALAAVFERPPLEAIELIRAEGLVVNYQDLRAGRTWTLDDGRLALDRRGGGLTLAATASLLTGGAEVTGVELSLTRGPGAEAAEARLAIEGASARDIATQSPALAWLSLLDAPLSLSSRAGIAPDGTLGEVTAELAIGAGALRPGPSAAPLDFQSAGARLRFQPDRGRVVFDEVSVRSDDGSGQARGQALLGGTGPGGLPRSLVGQFELSAVRLEPGLWPEPLRLPAAWAEFRLSLDPFRAEVGSLVVEDAAGMRLAASGEVRTGAAGWQVDAEAEVPEIGVARLMALWPPAVRPGVRSWFETNLTGGVLSDSALALRLRQGAPPVFWASHDFAGATIRVLPEFPPIEDGVGRLTFQGPRIAVALDAGTMRPPEGGLVDAAGTTLVIADAAADPSWGEVALRTESTITAALSLIDLPPFGFVSKAGLVPTVADGRARVEGTLRFPFAQPMPEGAVAVDVTADLSQVQSDDLVPGRDLAAARLSLAVDNDRLSVGGPLRIGAVPVEGTWSRALGAGTGGSARVEADVTLSQEFLQEFGIGLPRGSLSGEGRGRLTLEFPQGAAPRFALVSGLRGLSLRIPQVGWSKEPGTTGRLELAGTLGARPRVDRLLLDAPGLEAEGSLTARPGGGLERLRLDRLRVGDWLDAPVTLTGQGAGPPAVSVGGGRLDLRRADFGGAGDGGGGGTLEVALDRLQVTEAIALTGLRGQFDTAGGLRGSFAAEVNGGTTVRGSVAPEAGRIAVRLQSSDAGGAIRDAGLLANAAGGTLDLSLRPVGRASFDGALAIGGGLRVREAPELAQLLNAISVVGLLQQLDGQGLGFDSVQARFRLGPERLTVLSAAAVGPGLGLSLDGYFTLATRVMDFQGVISPIYFLNGIGSLLTRPGEGLVGFNFTLRGPVGAPNVAVNPLSLLTPGMFREIFRRPAPEVGQ